MRSQVKKLSAELKYANERITRLVSEVTELAEAAKNETAFAGIARIISPSAIEAADDTRLKMASAEGAAAAVAAAAGEKSDVSEARITQMARQLERLLYGGGAGNLERTRVLWAAVVERPAIQRLLNLTAPSEAKMAAAAKASMAHAKQARHALALCSVAHEVPPSPHPSDSHISDVLQVLASLKTGGTRTKADHLAFETILAALFPDNAKEDGLMRTLQALLGVDWDPLHRAELVNSTANLDELGSFSATVAEACARERRRDFRGEGRRICMECALLDFNRPIRNRIESISTSTDLTVPPPTPRYWHNNTRIDTRQNRKIRIRVGPNEYVEHWRHVRFDTCEQMCAVLSNPEPNSLCTPCVPPRPPPSNEFTVPTLPSGGKSSRRAASTPSTWRATPRCPSRSTSSTSRDVHASRRPSSRSARAQSTP